MQLDLSGAPAVITMGEPITQERGNVYAALLDRAIFPAVRPTGKDTALSYLQRCAKNLADHYPDVPLALTFGPVARVIDQAWDHDEVVQPDNAFAVSIATEQPHVIYAERFHMQLTERNRRLCASLFEHLARASRPYFDVFTPGTAISASEWVRFGDRADWWFQMREEAKDQLDIAETALDGVALRRYLRSSGITTPGMLAMQLGAHHGRIERGKRKILSLTACANAVAALPRGMRSKARALLAAAQELSSCAKRFAKRMTREAIIHGYMPMPTFIIETTGSDTVMEVFEELWQYAAQANGLGPHCAFTLTEHDVQRLTHALDLYAQAHRCMQTLAQKLNEE